MIQSGVEHVAIDQAGEVAAHQHAAHLIDGHTVHPKQIGERHPVRNLVERGRPPGPGDRREERAGRRRRAVLTEGLRAVPVQERQIGQRLDIAHHRGKTRHALFEWAWGLVSRLGRAAVEDADRRGLLACHIGRFDRDHADRQPVEQRAVDFGQCRLDSFGRPSIGDVDVGASRLDHPRRQPEPVEDQVRTMSQQPSVLDRRRLALLAVGITMTAPPRRRPLSRTVRTLTASGNAAPPRPSSPDRLTSLSR